MESLREHLRERLPDYMVPTAYVRLESLPLSPNGKIDRRALPEPEASAYGARRYEEPANEIEQAVAETWSEVLGVERVGRWDHFFELGGHSLLAVRVISRVRQILGVEVALGELFAHPVLVEFARVLEGAVRAELPPIERADRAGRLPLSFAQQRLWFLEQLGGIGTTYHIPRRFRLRGALDRTVLVRALERIVERHESLRTTFHALSGEPEQRIAAAEQHRFQLIELQLSTEPHVERALQRVIEEESREPFDLARGPLFRGRLIRIADDDHVLLLTMHHIVSDGWSMGVIVRELSTLYDAFRRGEPDPLLPLPLQYADYAAWQRQWVTEHVLAAQAEYWKNTLNGAPEVLELPADRVRPPRQDHAGSALRVELNEELTARLKDLSARHGTTLHMTLLTGLAAVLSRLSGQSDVVIGTPVANRGRREVEGLIGFFVNTLPLRVDLSGAPTVAELLARVKTCALGALQNQDIPFEQVVDLLQPVRSLAHSPLFQVMLAWQNAPGGALEFPGVSLTSVTRRTVQTSAKFDLLFSLSEVNGRITGSLEYATALFDRATVERYIEYLQRALEGMAAAEDQEVKQVSLLGDREREHVVEALNRTSVRYPPDGCVHELFEQQAEETPDAVALVFENEALSYRALDLLADELAAYLIEQGVGPDQPVGLFMKRSLDQVIAMLAILKARGVCLPLDLAYPAERLATMLADSNAAIVLTHERLTERPVFPGRYVSIESIPQAHAAVRPRPKADPESAVYLLYTSGSTGIPKGIELPHRALTNLIQWHKRELRAHPVMLQFASLGFDASFHELFGAWSTGGCIHLITENLWRDVDALVPFVAQRQIDRVILPVVVLQRWAMEYGAAPRWFATLREVITTGEQLQITPAVRSLFRQLPGTELHNHYGPAEAHVVTAHRLTGDPLEWPTYSPVGQPIANCTTYVLDESGEPVPVGVIGELYLGGVQIARGYWRRPDLTAQRFVADHMCGSGERLYRTGDRSRWRTDGTIEFLGRSDTQVKIRGFRVELGEIEARLLQHDSIDEATVIARADAASSKQLVAYYIAASNRPHVEARDLRGYVAERLPEFMVPSAYVRLERLPLTANGKVDRKALPLPEDNAFAQRAYAAPRDAIEGVIAETWQQLLGISAVGIHDNFFELGGHSLLAVRLTAHLRQTLLVEVSIQAVFEGPTVAQIADAVRRASYEKSLEEALLQVEQLSDTEVLSFESLRVPQLNSQH